MLSRLLAVLGSGLLVMGAPSGALAQERGALTVPMRETGTTPEAIKPDFKSRFYKPGGLELLKGLKPQR